MSAEISIGTPGAASVIGGIEAPIARLCGGQNLLRQHRWEFGLIADNDHWVASGSGTDVAQVAPMYDPTAIMARNILVVRDRHSGHGDYVRGKCDNGAALVGTSWVFSCWVKAVGGDTVNTNIRIRTTSADESIGSGDGKPGALAENEWVFFSRIFTFSTTGDSAFWVDFFPTPGLGSIGISKPRCHRILANISDLPDWPLRDWSFEPWLRTKAVRDRFGTIEVSRRGWVPRIRARHPVVDKSQHQAISAIYAHDGPIFFEPNIDAEIAFWMTPHRDEMDYRLIGDRAIGYSGSIDLIGTDPVYGIPDATLYIEEEHVVYYGIPRFVRAI